MKDKVKVPEGSGEWECSSMCGSIASSALSMGRSLQGREPLSLVRSLNPLSAWHGECVHARVASARESVAATPGDGGEEEGRGGSQERAGEEEEILDERKTLERAKNNERRFYIYTR